MAKHHSDRHTGGYQPRKEVRPLAGKEAQDWPEMDDAERLTQTLSRRAFEAGYDGGDPDGEPLRLANIVENAVEGWMADAKRAAAEKVDALTRLIARAPREAKKAVAHADDHDRVAAQLVDDAQKLRTKRDGVRERLEHLNPTERGGRLEGKEGVLAAVSTGVLDGSVFVLMIASLGGAIELRIAVAAGLAAALTVVVAAAGRLVAEIWRRLSTASARIAVSAIVVMLAGLIALVGAAIVSGGEFRAEAVLSLDRGAPADPHFLVWIQSALALAATCAIGAYHVAGEGEHLRRRDGELTGEIEDIEVRITAARNAACEARDAVLDIMADSDAAEATLPLVPQALEGEIEKIRARGKQIVEVVFERFEAGQTARAKDEAARSRPFRTVDDEIAEAVRVFAARQRGYGAEDN